MLTTEHLALIRSREFRLRADKAYTRIANGEPMTFDMMASEWGLPLEVAIGGFQFHMATAGQVFVPKGMESPIAPEMLQCIADSFAMLASAEPEGHA